MSSSNKMLGSRGRTSRLSLVTTIAAVWMAFATAGCAMDFEPASSIRRTKLVGARLNVVGEPGRANIASGDDVEVEWWILAPEPTQIGGVLYGCLLLPVNRGAPTCVPGTVFPIDDRQPTLPPWNVALTVPEGLSGRSILLVGAMCDESQATLDVMSGIAACTNGSQPEVFSLSAAIGGLSNQHPDIELGTFVIAGVELSAGATDPCSAGLVISYSSLALEDERRVAEVLMTLPEESRERYLVMPDGDERRESLQISQYVTAGELSRAFSAYDEMTVFPISFDWLAPETAPTEAQPVSMFFVTRDLRGGTSLTERRFCLTP